MLAALQRYPRAQRRAIAQEWAKRSHAAQATARMAREPDAETQRRRALDDQRGTVLRTGITYHPDGSTTPWQIVRARIGRVNQVEILVDGRAWRRCSLRTATRLLNR